MKNTGKKVIAVALLSMALASPTNILAKDLDKVEVISEEVATVEEENLFQGDFLNFEGKIKSAEIKENEIQLLVEGEDDELIFHISEDILVLDMKDTRENKRMHLEEGALVRVVYGKETPMTASLPGQLTPDVVVVLNGEEGAGETVTVDRFDEELLSSDKFLKLNLPEEEADIYRGKVLAVYYDVVTMSIPAQTTPNKIIVVAEVKNLDKIIIDGEEIELNMHYNNEGTLMIPAREVLEKLGYEIKWDGRENPIEIMKGAQWTSVKLGENSYTFARMSPFKLDAAPVLGEDSKTYLPVSFLEKVLRLEEIKVENGRLSIK